MSLPVFERFLATPDIGAEFADASVLQGLFRFEAALARAQAAAGESNDDDAALGRAIDATLALEPAFEALARSLEGLPGAGGPGTSDEEER